MALFARIHSQFRADRLILANCLRVPELNLFFFDESRFCRLKLVNRRFEALRANRSHIMTIAVLFFRLVSRESPRLARCPGHSRETFFQISTPNRSGTLPNKGFGASGLKIGVLQKRRFNDHRSNAPFSALLSETPKRQY